MGGQGSGRKSVKAEAVFCLLDVQMALQKIQLILLAGNATRDEISNEVKTAIRTVKSKQEDIETL